MYTNREDLGWEGFQRGSVSVLWRRGVLTMPRLRIVCEHVCTLVVLLPYVEHLECLGKGAEGAGPAF